MFKTAFEDEIYRSMEKKLVANQDDENLGLSKLAKATDYLNAAAEIFEQAGMVGPAEEITEVLQDVAIEQLTSQAFSIEDITKLDKGTLHDLLANSAPAQFINLAKKILSVVSGEKKATETIKEMLKEGDLSDPEVRERFIKRVMLGLQIAKFVV